MSEEYLKEKKTMEILSDQIKKINDFFTNLNDDSKTESLTKNITHINEVYDHIIKEYDKWNSDFVVCIALIELLGKTNENFKNRLQIENISKSDIDYFYNCLYIDLTIFASHMDNSLKNKSLAREFDQVVSQKNKLEQSLIELKLIKEDIKNKKVNEIFEDDSEKFKNLARKYEIAFYLSLVFLFLYFFGWYIEIDTSILKFKFAEQFHGNHSATFYVQKISLLILSTTLAAFLLKRSFMNRRLADEAYRTAKELDALPRYMEGMPDEMKEKIRFDLAYKYFGNGIHHDSYTSGENLMHENIKANTEFVKVLKGEPSTTDESKADKDKNE
ncbi:hypothetical protein [Acinetobacter baylyi]|uniref:hypothetical protein n=1 Tax=Acinetobacter baylyi TaxID=202950 RepID=UPI0031D7FC6A